ASCSKSAVMKTMVEAMLLAVTPLGEDGRGKDGLNGYLRAIARADPKAFLSLFGRLLVCPSQFESEEKELTHGGALEMFCKQIEEIARRRKEEENEIHNCNGVQ